MRGGGDEGGEMNATSASTRSSGATSPAEGGSRANIKSSVEAFLLGMGESIRRVSPAPRTSAGTEVAQASSSTTASPGHWIGSSGRTSASGLSVRIIPSLATSSTVTAVKAPGEGCTARLRFCRIIWKSMLAFLRLRAARVNRSRHASPWARQASVTLKHWAQQGRSGTVANSTAPGEDGECETGSGRDGRRARPALGRGRWSQS